MEPAIAARGTDPRPLGVLRVDDALQALFEHGVVSVADVVSGDAEVTELSRRNLNLRVAVGAAGWLVKQPDPLRDGGARTLARELELYELCERPSFAELGGLLPGVRVLRRDPPLFAVEWLEGARSPWREYRASSPDRLPLAPARELGEALARLHSVFHGRSEDPELEPLGFPKRPADFLSIHRPEPRELRRFSGAQIDLLRLVQSEPAIGRELDRVRFEWRPETLLHGDVRAANQLVLPDLEGGERRLFLIDWELVKWGDPAWDVGCALADLVHFWVRGMPRRPGLSPEQRAEQASVRLPALAPLFGALWDAYAATRRGLETPGDRQALQLRAVRCSAGRMIQAAWQRVARSSVLGIPERALIQVAANVLRDPEAARRGLYGLRSGPAAA